MANFCKKCGHELPENATFCGECGAPVPKEAAPVTAAPAAEKTEKTLSLWAYVGLFLLFNLPFVGWIVCIVMAFAPKNANIRHFAGGLIVYILIISILTVGLFFAVRNVVAGVFREVKETVAEEFGDILADSVSEAVDSLDPEERAQLEKALNDGLTETFASLSPEDRAQIGQILAEAAD